jgi:hypothetical protein
MSSFKAVSKKKPGLISRAFLCELLLVHPQGRKSILATLHVQH